MKNMLAYGEKMENQKMKVQGKAEDDEDLDFENFAEDDANMVEGFGGTDIIDHAVITFWI